MRNVVISGGSSGIGLACAMKFIANGDFVYNLDIVNCNDLHDQENYDYIHTDVTDKNSIQLAIDLILKKKDKIDVLILSAGKHLSKTIEETSDEQLFDIINLNLIAPYWLIQKLIPVMRSNKKGRIITIGSDQSLIAKSSSTVYGMSKAGLASLTKSVALDYAKYNITANCIAAGTIDTPLYRKAIDMYSKKTGIPLDKIENMEAAEQPLGRIGRPEEVAEMAFFLAEEKSGFITGAVLSVDGGYTAK